MKRRAERDFGKLMIEACSMIAAQPRAKWRAVMEGGGESEVCKVVGVMMFVDQDGLPLEPGFVLESLDGNRIYTTNRACAYVPPALAA